LNDRVPTRKDSATPTRAARTNRPTLSVVVPLKDEEASIPVLVERILQVSRDAGLDLADIVVVDDGSLDATWPALEALAERHPELSALRLRRNFGKATALMVGVGVASGDIIVTMDGDLQDDPEELPRFVAAIEAGADLVSGWKKERHDPLSKTMPSRLFNWVTAWASGIKLHDFNCGYKAYRREIFETVQLYGELHRYAPVLADALGFRVAEITVRHHPRRFGRTKYGAGRFLRGFLDLLTVLMITRFAYRPSHLFGGIGTVLLLIGGALVTYLVGLKLFTGAEIGARPLLLLGVFIAIVGVQLLLFGMLAELIVSRSQGPVGFRDLVAKQVGRRVPPA
jgi:glycosyltransferase involved in cell wall biosynthesis